MVMFQVFGKLFNPLLVEDDTAHKVSKKQLELFTRWLTDEEAPAQMKMNLLQITKCVHPQVMLRKSSLTKCYWSIMQYTICYAVFQLSHYMVAQRPAPI